VNADHTTGEPTPTWRAGLEFIEALAKVALAFAVIGYIALRAHLNSLGIPFRESAPPERYLMEMWGWVVASLFPLVKPACSVGLVMWGVSALLVFLLRKVKNGTARWGKVRAIWKREWGEIILLTILAVACIATALMVEIYCRAPAVLSGPMTKIENPPQAAKDLYLVLVIVWLFESVFWLGRRVVKTATASRRVFALAMIAILTLQLPMIYGWLIREARYPAVTLAVKAGDTTKDADGILIFETAERFIVWRASKGSGQLASYLREEVVSVTASRSLNVRDVVNQALAQPGSDWPAAALLPAPAPSTP
jgi:hypothetical protein